MCIAEIAFLGLTATRVPVDSHARGGGGVGSPYRGQRPPSSYYRVTRRDFPPARYKPFIFRTAEGVGGCVSGEGAQERARGGREKMNKTRGGGSGERVK